MVVTCSSEHHALLGMEHRLDMLEQEVQVMRQQMSQQEASVAAQKAQLIAQLNEELVKHKLVLVEVVEEAKKEFTTVHMKVKNLYDEASGAVVELKERLDNVEKESERSGGKHGGGGGMKGYLPVKAMLPNPFSDKPEEWRQWQEDMMDYLDSITPGMKAFLKEVADETEAVDDAWLMNAQQEHSTKITGDELAVWRALKTLTTGEARKVVTSIRTENGYRAWQKLHQRFGPSLSCKQGMVLMEFSAMVSKPAKTPDETRHLITEMERRIKMVEEVTGEDVSENHAKSVLVGILDPLTRQHTAMHHGSKASCEQLKRVVLEFANNVARGPDAMHLGAIGQQDGEEDEHAHLHGDWDTEMHDHFVGAFGKGATQCYACQGYGHMARDCPTKGKGKGKADGKGKGGFDRGKGFDRDGYKGKGKGKDGGGGKYGPAYGSKGKGKRAPMYGGCWNCGGSHFADSCPMKGGGKGKGLNQISESGGSQDYWDPGWSEHVPSLGAITEVTATGTGEWKTVQKSKNKIVNTVQEKVKPKLTQTSPPGKGRVAGGNRFDMLSMIRTIEPENVSRIEARGDGWEVIELAVDSGASETVISEDMLSSVEVKEGEASRRGVQYEVANGVRIPNLGEKKFKGHTEEGMVRNLTAQVCEVNKALLSVRKVVQAGNKVVFDIDGSYIEDKNTGQKMWLKEENGMYMLRMWVKNGGF